MRTTIAILTLILGTVACAENPKLSTFATPKDPMCLSNQFNCTFEPKSWQGTIDFRVDANTNEICNKLMGTNDPGIVSCATRYSETKCVIYVKTKTSMALIGHEFRHCSEGRWHE